MRREQSQDTDGDAPSSGISKDSQQTGILCEQVVEQTETGILTLARFGLELGMLASRAATPAAAEKAERLLLWARAAAADEHATEPALPSAWPGLLRSIHVAPEFMAASFWKFAPDDDRIWLRLMPELSDAAHRDGEENPGSADAVKACLKILVRQMVHHERRGESLAPWRAWIRRHPKMTLRLLCDEIEPIHEVMRDKDDWAVQVVSLVAAAVGFEGNDDGTPSSHQVAQAYGLLLAAARAPLGAWNEPGAATALRRHQALENSVLDQVAEAQDRAESQGRHITAAETRAAVDRAVRVMALMALKAPARALRGGNGHVVRPLMRGYQPHAARAPDGRGEDSGSDGDPDGEPPQDRRRLRALVVIPFPVSPTTFPRPTAALGRLRTGVAR